MLIMKYFAQKKFEDRRTYDLITPDSIFTTKLPHIVSETALPSLHLNCLGINHIAVCGAKDVNSSILIIFFSNVYKTITHFCHS